MSETIEATTEAITTSSVQIVDTGLNVELINSSVYFATALLGLAVLWWLAKWLYKLFNMFF